jgi:hypothetical protein
LNGANNFHATDYSSKCGESLPVGIALASEIKLGLVTDHDGKI